MNYWTSLWNFLLVSAPWLLVGLLVAGFVHHLISVDLMRRVLGKESFLNVFKAALLGVPLPLCSCAVIPTAVTLKKSGAGNAPTSSFLVSTPESGIDSIAMTYAMMDFPMTVIRPFAAMISAVIAGTLQLLFNPDDKGIKVESDTNHEEVNSTGCCSTTSQLKEKIVAKGPYQRLKSIISYAFGDLLNDMALWLGAGLVLGALIEMMLPPDFFLQIEGWQSRLIVLFIGVPIYICASATTPIAAAMMMKGMAPGVALMLLLVGPATNIFNIAILQKYIGKRGVALNIVAIATTALILSYLVDWLYFTYQWPLDFNLSKARDEHMHSSWWEVASAILLTGLIIKGIVKNEIIDRLISAPHDHGEQH